MNGMALCSGIGGLELGIKLACPSLRTVAHVEGDAYAASVLAARMEEGRLDPAPIWSDVRTFDGRAWRGVVDIVTAGFPCQPFSVAGKRRHEDDERHLWPQIARIIGECEPALVFLENVSIRAFVEPWRDLRGLGFNLSRPFACTAAELGAGHLRRRVFVLAYRNSKSCEVGSARREGVPNLGGDGALGTSAENRARQQSGRRCGESRPGATEPRPTASNTESRSSRPAGSGTEAPATEAAASSDTALGPRRQRVSLEEWNAAIAPNGRSDWWASEPDVEKLVYGIPNRVDRDRALGNAVVPQMAAFAFGSLMISTGTGHTASNPPKSMRPSQPGVPADSTEIELTAKAGAGRSEVRS